MPDTIFSEERTNKEYLRQQAWNYFQMHATQRLTTFNYYLAISTAITAAIAITFQKDYQIPALGMILSLMLIAVSLIFWKLDGRNIELIELAESALKYFEEIEKSDFPDEAGGKPHKVLLFTHEEQDSTDKDGTQMVHFKYKTCLNLTIFLFIGGGFVALALALLNTY
jgi:hypothetical protein